MCNDCFSFYQIVFSEAWWIGNKEDNPEEARLDFPKELTGVSEDIYTLYFRHPGALFINLVLQEHLDDCDFRGGAGSTTENKSGVTNQVQKFEKDQSPVTDLENDSSKSENNVAELLKQTPTRQSARTSGKSYKYEFSSLQYFLYPHGSPLLYNVFLHFLMCRFAEAFSSDDESSADISIISEKKVLCV